MEGSESEAGCFPDDAPRLTRLDRERMEELSHHIWAEVWDWLDSECDVGSEVAGYVAQATAAAFEAAYRVQFEVSSDVGEVGRGERKARSRRSVGAPCLRCGH